MPAFISLLLPPISQLCFIKTPKLNCSHIFCQSRRTELSALAWKQLEVFPITALSSSCPLVFMAAPSCFEDNNHHF